MLKNHGEGRLFGFEIANSIMLNNGLLARMLILMSNLCRMAMSKASHFLRFESKKSETRWACCYVVARVGQAMVTGLEQFLGQLITEPGMRGIWAKSS